MRPKALIRPFHPRAQYCGLVSHYYVSCAHTDHAGGRERDFEERRIISGTNNGRAKRRPWIPYEMYGARDGALRRAPYAKSHNFGDSYNALGYVIPRGCCVHSPVGIGYAHADGRHIEFHKGNFARIIYRATTVILVSYI